MTTAPIPLHETALDTRKSLGRLDRNEMQALVKRFVSYWQFDLRQLLIAQIRELQHRRRGSLAKSNWTSRFRALMAGSARLAAYRRVSAHIPAECAQHRQS